MDNYRSIGKIITVLHRYTQMYFMKELEDLGLHGQGQIQIVLTLARYKEGVIQDELARSLLVDKASISRMILPLVSSGIVERDVSPGDRRAYTVKLARKYRAHIPEIRSRAKKWTGIVSAGFTAKDLEKLFFYLDKLEKNARQYVKGEDHGKEDD